MNQPLFRLVSIFVLMVSISGCVSKAQYLKQVSETDTTKAQVAALLQQVASTNSSLEAAKVENSKLLNTLDAKKGELNQRVSDLSKENQDLARQIREIELAKQAEIDKLKGTYEQLVGELQSEITSGQIQITQLAGRLSVNMVDKILFNSGEASVKPAGEKVLQQVGAALKNIKDKAIRVEGHTDNVPISSSLRDRFPTNWELSTARATAVVRYLQEKTGIPADRLIAAGYGEFHPVAANTTPEGKAQNRRIEITLVTLEPASPYVPAPTIAAPAAAPTPHAQP